MKTVSYTYERPTGFYNELCEKIVNDTHVLIGGATRSGKSVLVDNIIYYLLRNRTPNNTRLILIDPKKVSLRKYINLPHVDAYADNNADIISTLKNLVGFMEELYTDMQARGIYKSDGAHFFVIVDELGDLLTTCKKECLPLLQRIAQLGGASNIHLIACTQSPSRKTIPAELVLNFTGRVALRCASATESKQVLNGFTGAEKLPKHGYCIYNDNGIINKYTIDMLPDESINEIVNYWIDQTSGQYPTIETTETKTKSVNYQWKNNKYGIMGRFAGAVFSALFGYGLLRLILWIFTP